MSTTTDIAYIAYRENDTNMSKTTNEVYLLGLPIDDAIDVPNGEILEVLHILLQHLFHERERFFLLPQAHQDEGLEREAFCVIWVTLEQLYIQFHCFIVLLAIVAFLEKTKK